MGQRYNILILEPAPIVQKGLRRIAEEWEFPVKVNVCENIAGLPDKEGTADYDLVFVNPASLGGGPRGIARLQQLFEGTPLIGLMITAYDRRFIEHFQAVISLTDPDVKIHNLMSRCLNTSGHNASPAHGLSERETEVLKLIVQGKTNKEIADHLFISTHTVISHRKNITTKLGIKTSAALAIYAVANHLVDIDSIIL